MKKQTIPLKASILCLVMAAISVAGLAQKPVKFVGAAILRNMHWTADTIYYLRGYIYVGDGNLSGIHNVTLTIDPGTLIKGDTSTTNSTKKGALVITRGSKIIANGTPCKPIVFTSAKAVGKRNRGDWGGLILLGYAPINAPGGVANIEGIPANDTTKYGGNNATDNSGILSFVRVEFAGVALTPNNEINGITFGGVGSATNIDYVQVSFSNDDSYEWFGGTVNCKHLIALRGIDDDFDTDQGYSGKVQYAVSLRDPKVADVSGSKGFESDNDATGDSASPQTRARFCNVSLIAGADTTANSLFIAGAHIRRNSHFWSLNNIILGWPEGLLIDGASTEANVTMDTLVESNIIATKYSPSWVVTTPSNTTVNNELLTQAHNQFFSNGNAGVMLTSPYNLTKPNFLPKAGSPALGAANFGYNALQDAFFDVVNYIGAFGTTDWTAQWANFDPQNTDYTGGSQLTFSGVVTNTGCTNGAIDITVPGDSSAYNYSWSDGATTQDRSGLAAGSYTVTVQYATDATCTAARTFKVTSLSPKIISGSSSQTTVTIVWDTTVNSEVSYYQVRKKLSSTTTQGPWITVRSGNTYTFTGLTKNTSYDFQVRGKCPSGPKTYTFSSPAFTYSTCNTCRVAALDDNNTMSINGAVLYPNPNNGNFRLNISDFSGPVIIKVANSSGSIIYNQQVNGASKFANVNVSLPNAPSGLYMVTITDGTKTINAKVSIVK